MNRDGGSHGWPRIVLGFGLIFAVFALFFAAGFGITAFIYRYTGPPPEVLAHILSGLTAFLLLGAVVGIFQAIRRHSDVAKRHQGIHNQLLDALAQIAQGNFEVLIDTDDHHVHHDIAHAINEMAKNLGTLETMRQDFISNVSHEIQSPLTSIRGFAALLKNDSLPAEQRQHYAAIIEAESKRLSSLSENLLKLSALENGKKPLSFRDFRLDKQLESVALTLEPQWSAKRLLVEADLQKCSFYGDEDLLSQVWINILHNAIKFTPEGGQINITLTADGDMGVVKITDTGAGIAPEEQFHIFERFYKVDKARDRSLGGNGLGLSLVKKIVELHGGRVTVDSEITKGSVFQVFLPGLHCV